MRLKEDSDSWKSNGIIKRDFRHDNSDTLLRKKPSKKDTKKWCKGKVGIIHVWIDVDKSSISFFSWHTRKCTNCGKKDIEFNKLQKPFTS